MGLKFDTKVRIEHIGEGYLKVWKSDGMQAAVDRAGERIAAEAGDGFGYMPSMGNFTAMGFVSSMGYEAAIEEQDGHALSKAVHS